MRSAVPLAMLALVAAGAAYQIPLEMERARIRSIQIDAEKAAVYVEIPVPPTYTGGGQGSGVYVDDYVVLTVAHNHPHPALDIVVRNWRGESSPAEVIARDPRHDLMLLRVHHKAPAKLDPARAIATRGDWIVTVGAPLASAGLVSYGRVSGVNPIGGTLLLDVSATYGSSGAAIVALQGRDAGRIAGIAFRVWGNQHMSMLVAVDATVVRRFLESHGVD